jgi:hypothetical protein
MMDCRTMSNPMEMNMKLLVDTLYRQMIVSLIYLMNTQARYMLCCEHLESISSGAHTCSPCSCKSCDEIP